MLKMETQVVFLTKGLKMTQEELFKLLPQIIKHRRFGECYLRVVEDTVIRKAASYINKEGTQAIFCYARSWTYLYRKLREKLRDEGLAK